MTRTLLVFNPRATSVSARVRDVIAHALAAETKLEVAQTKRRGHATHIAAGAVHEGFDLVVCLSGDGTLNEVVNGLAGTGVPVAPLPGGGTNVFARTLGLPRDPVEATAVILERLRDRAAPRTVNLGSVNGRFFTFCAGVGYDAAVVRAVERNAGLRRTFGDSVFVSTALRVFFFGYPRHRRPITVRSAGTVIPKLTTAIVCNSDPYTYLGARPFHLCPAANLDAGLDVIGLRSLRTPGALSTIFRAFGSGSHVDASRIALLHDRDAVDIVCEEPMPYQLDGDYLGEATRFEVRLAERALAVLC